MNCPQFASFVLISQVDGEEVGLVFRAELCPGEVFVKRLVGCTTSAPLAGSLWVCFLL